MGTLSPGTQRGSPGDLRASAAHGGVVGFYPSDDTTASRTDASQRPRQLRESVQAVPADTPRPDDTPEALAAELGIELGEPCKQCRCTLRYHSGEYLMCHQCHPRPLRSGGLNDEQWERLRAQFPHRG